MNAAIYRYANLLLLICFFTSTQAQAQTWQIVNSNNDPSAREECAFVKVGSKFYLLGGRGNGKVQEYNPATNSWTDKANPPLEMHHFQAVEYNGKIYVMGAFNGGFPSEDPIPNIYIYNPANNSWQTGPSIPSNRRRGSAGLVIYNNEFYMVCGIQNGHLSGWVPWLDKYNPNTNNWTTLPDAPRSRDHFQAALIGDKIYVAGGRRSGQNGTFAPLVTEVDVYDISDHQWTTLPSSKNIPTGRAGTASIVIGNEFLVIGGESLSQNSAHDETEGFNVSTNSWHTWDNLNTGRHGTGALLYNNKVYICAGAQNRGGGAINSMEVLDLGSSQQAPTVSISSPTNGSIFPVNANITITANASDADGSIDHVSFYYGNTLIGNDYNAPYSVTWNNVPTGDYSLTAKATDNDNETTTSNSVNIIVGNPSGISVASFTLVNADDDQDIRDIDDGDIIYTGDLPSTNITFRANTNPMVIGSVIFDLDGSNNYRTESVEPYTLQGDNNGDYNAWNYSLGNHTLTGRPFTGGGGSGTPGLPKTISFEITDQEPPDCNGDPGGTAYLNDCNICVGGSTGLPDDEGKDDCGVCSGNNADKDCNGVCFGTAYLNDCNICVGGTTGLTDDEGKDDCGVCSGNNADKDCNGECFGTAYIDDCGTCVGGSTGISPCVLDCNRDPNGTAYIDDCGVCSGGNSGHIANSDQDDCGVCFGNNADKDCNGDCFGTAYVDDCGICVGGNTGNTACPSDCNGDPNGTAFLDDCGICSGGNSGHIANSDQDDCGICFGNNADKDCNGDCFGSAYLDACGTCVGGSTGNSPCVIDCNGDPGGTAFVDTCGVCAGGNTGITPDQCNCDLLVTSITLIDASTNNDIGPLHNGDVINLYLLPSFSLRANVCDPVGSVQFVVNGSVEKTENIPPYSIAGDGNNGTVYYPWNPGTGAYTITANPYSGGGASGTLGFGKTFSITIIDKDEDCNGDIGGTAYINECGICVGGNSGAPEDSGKDDCGVCFGNNLNRDCAGVCFGTSVEDCNGVCNGPGVLDGSGNCCPSGVLDCNGVCDGPAVEDACGVCGGDGSSCCTGPEDCDDGDPCTVNACDNGDCVFTPVDCDDSDPCTIDYCDEGLCLHDAEGVEPPYLKVENIPPFPNWRKLKLGNNPNSVWGPAVDVTDGGNNKQLEITFRDADDAVNWTDILVKPNGSGNVAFSDYLPPGGVAAYPAWTTISIPLSAFSGVDFTSISNMNIPFSSGHGAFEIHLQRIEFTGGDPFLYFGGANIDNASDAGDGYSLAVELVEGSPCGSAKNSGPGKHLTQPENTGLRLDAFPNPFEDQVTIEFLLPETTKIRLEILSMEGRSIAVLQEGMAERNKLHKVTFDANNLAEGLYMYRLVTEKGEIYNRKLMLVR